MQSFLPDVIKRFFSGPRTREILWVVVVGPDFESQKMVESFESAPPVEGIHRIVLGAHEVPNWNLEIQFALHSAVSESPLTWPFHVFLCGRSKKVIFIAPSLGIEEAHRLSKDLMGFYLIEKEKAAEAFLSQLDFSQIQAPFLGKVPQLNIALREAILNPLLQSFDSKSGGFGSGERLMLYPAAYRALRCVESGGPSLSEMGIVQILKTSLWDPWEGGFWRYSSPLSQEIGPEKLLIPNMEMLVQMAIEWRDLSNPFIEDCLFQGLKFVKNRFIGPNEQLYSQISYPLSRDLFVESNDLLMALNHSERMLAQEFYGLGARGRIPTIKRNLADLCREFSWDLTEMRLKLIDVQNKLRIHRDSKVTPQRTRAAEWECERFYFYGSLLNKICGEIFEIPWDELSSLEPQGFSVETCRFRSLLSGDGLLSVLDTEFGQSQLGFELEKLALDERSGVIFSLENELRKFHTLGLKGMGWMSFYLGTRQSTSAKTVMEPKIQEIN